MNVLDTLWLDGRLVRSADAWISAVDHGLTVGDGVFETMKVVRGEAFALTRHIARLRRSAGALRLEVPFGDDELRLAIRGVIDANPDAGRVRLTVTGGPGPLGSGRATAGTSQVTSTATVIVAATVMTEYSPTATVVTVPWCRNERGPLAGVKSTSYAENVITLDYARGHGTSEAIFANTVGDLCEGTGTNVFLSDADAALVTPPLSSGCLGGITREIVLELVTATQRPIPLGDLATATEAFLTSSTRGVQPIESVDGHALPQCPGPLTTQAMDAYTRVEATSTDP